MPSVYHNHTSDLSAAMTNSSVSSSLNNFESITQPVDKKVQLEQNDDRQTQEEIGKSGTKLLSKLFHSGRYEALIAIAQDALLEFPNSLFIHNLLGETYAKLGDDINAIKHYDNSVEIMSKNSEIHSYSNYMPNIHNNLGVALKAVGFLDRAEVNLKKALEYDPTSSSVFNNYGNLQSDKADIKTAQKHFLKAIEMDPTNFKAYWNLHSTVDRFDHAKDIIELCLEQAPNYSEAIFMLAGLNAFSGNTSHLKKLMKTEFKDHPLLTSINWILSLPVLPEIYFNRWAVMDRAIQLCDTKRPFYEYGVWMGDSFKYIMKSFDEGFGFDTFEGLPEQWGPVPKGTYSSFGAIPTVPGAHFIIGRFEETLPEFFKVARAKASLINLDADLYSSTLCALLNSQPIIDSKTVLIFDEFIVNENWEKDEYKALNEFCEIKNLTYEVLALSLFSKQVVVRIVNKP
jgi:tetratricopeptide (TPR) repeat protein